MLSLVSNTAVLKGGFAGRGRADDSVAALKRFFHGSAGSSPSGGSPRRGQRVDPLGRGTMRLARWCLPAPPPHIEGMKL